MRPLHLVVFNYSNWTVYHKLYGRTIALEINPAIAIHLPERSDMFISTGKPYTIELKRKL